MATHSSTLAWKIPWTEEPGRLQYMGSRRSDMTERLHFHFLLSCIGGGNGNPLQCSCLENPRDSGAWWAAILGLHRVGHDWSDLAEEMWVWFLSWEDPLEKEMPVHSSALAWEIPWTQEPGREQSVGFQKSWTQLSNWTTATTEENKPAKETEEESS